MKNKTYYTAFLYGRYKNGKDFNRKITFDNHQSAKDYISLIVFEYSRLKDNPCNFRSARILSNELNSAGEIVYSSDEWFYRPFENDGLYSRYQVLKDYSKNKSFFKLSKALERAKKILQSI